MTTVITTCTSRKREPIPDGLRISALRASGMEALAAQWMTLLGAATKRYPAAHLYGGRGFNEVRHAADLLRARFFIVSGGLGLVEAAAAIPSYACTIIHGSPDDVEPQIDGEFSVRGWWSALAKQSIFTVAMKDALCGENELILAALSDGYIEMIASDLLALPLPARSRLRLFTRAPIERVPVSLAPFVMPYDARLDGPDSPIPGTISDFAGRALRHFVDHILVHEDRHPSASHAARVADALAGWRTPERVTRIRLDDAGILAVLREHHADSMGMSLGRLRNEAKVACEQGRYARLARLVRSVMP